MGQCQWSKASGRLSESCKQVQWCQEELADPLLNSGSGGHTKCQIPFPHMCAHTPLSSEKVSHNNLPQLHVIIQGNKPWNPFWWLKALLLKRQTYFHKHMEYKHSRDSGLKGAWITTQQQKAAALHNQHIPNPKSNSSVQWGRTPAFPKGLGNTLT